MSNSTTSTAEVIPTSVLTLPRYYIYLLIFGIFFVPSGADAQSRHDREATRLPSYSLLEQNYPTGSVEATKKLIGGHVDMNWVTNTCAVRLSHALNQAGHRIPKTFPGYGPNDFSVPGKNGRRYMWRVEAVIDYLTKTFGPPTFTHNYAAGDVREVPSQILDKKGIIIFRVSTWRDATGHADLWNGSACVYQCHFLEANEVLFWECRNSVEPGMIDMEIIQ